MDGQELGAWGRWKEAQGHTEQEGRHADTMDMWAGTRSHTLTAETECIRGQGWAAPGRDSGPGKASGLQAWSRASTPPPTRRAPVLGRGYTVSFQ